MSKCDGGKKLVHWSDFMAEVNRILCRLAPGPTAIAVFAVRDSEVLFDLALHRFPHADMPVALGQLQAKFSEYILAAAPAEAAEMRARDEAERAARAAVGAAVQLVPPAAAAAVEAEEPVEEPADQHEAEPPVGGES